MYAGCGLDEETDGRVSLSNLQAVLIVNCVFNYIETEVKSLYSVLSVMSRLQKAGKSMQLS